MSGSMPTSGSATGTAEGREAELQKEISGTIEAQVQRLIEQARLDTEQKVKQELKVIRDAMVMIDLGLDQLLAQLDGMEPPAEAPLDAEEVHQLLSKIEQQWGTEIRTLKQELHQTILAHNHNADLIKLHKDTIDNLREKCAKLQSNSVKTSEIQHQLQKLDARLKQQQKQRKLEPIFERLGALETAVAAAVAQGNAAWRYPGSLPMVPPGMALPGSLAAGVVPGMSAMGMAAAAGGKGAVPKAAGTGPAAGKAGEKAAFKIPTDEEVQARLSKLSAGGEVPSPTVVPGKATAAASEVPAAAATTPKGESAEAPPGL